MKDHDRLFKRIVSLFFLQFLDLFLPRVRSSLEPESIVFLDKEIFTDVTEGERHEADLVVQARLKGEENCFLIHIESQAQHQREFNQRMFSYFARIHEKHRLPVYPIVLFSYDRPRDAQDTSYVVEIADLVVLEFNYRVIQLNQFDWRQFVRSENPVATALMAKMNIGPGDRPRVKVECLRLLATLKLDPARMGLIWEFVETYADLTASEMREYEAALEKLPKQESEAIMESKLSWLHETRDEARHEGLVIGRGEGRVEGRQETAQRMAIILMEQLEKRIGSLDPNVHIPHHDLDSVFLSFSL